jgi:hypothetical protein
MTAKIRQTVISWTFHAVLVLLSAMATTTLADLSRPLGEDH